jgi:hypothetical protein
MLSFMAMDFFRTSPLLGYPIAALALFMGVFFVVSLRTAWTRAERYAHVARLPLQDSGTERQVNHE